MAYVDKEKAIQEILELFEYQLSMLTRLDKFEVMEIRKRIRDVILPTIRMDIGKPEIIMEIIEDKLQDVFRLFYDEIDFKEKLDRKINQRFKAKY